MFKETKQKSVRGIKAGAGETRDAKERQNAEQTHKQTKGAPRLSASGAEGEEKCEFPQNVRESPARAHVSQCVRGAGGRREVGGWKSARPLLAADSSESKARCVAPDKIRGRAASPASRQ